MKKINKIKFIAQMKYQKMNQEMVRYHDNVKPRPLNPTFSSFNVGVTLGATMARSQSLRNMGMKSDLFDSQRMTPTKNQLMDEQNSSKGKFSHSHRRSQSNLLNYGMSSLSPLKKQINDKEIYQKQAKKYNIVTIQPKQYMDSINVFPKYRLQNSDQSFHKKIVASNQLLATRNSPTQQNQMQRILGQKLSINPENFSQLPPINKQSR